MYGVVNQNKPALFPFVETCYQQGAFSDLDLFFAKTLVKQLPAEKKCEASVFFLSFLMACHRNGHVCISRDLLSVFSILWDEMEDPSVPKEEFFSKSCALFQQGKEAVERDLIHKDDGDFPSKPIVEHMGCYYLQKNWLYETKIIEHIRRLVTSMRSAFFDAKLFHDLLEQRVLHNTITPQQAEAILGVFNTKFCMIYGGPGTGKTYVASHLISLFSASFLPKDRIFHVFVAAPTGKAASHLLSKVKQQFSGQEKNISLKANTLHALLGMRKGEKKAFAEQLILADLVLIDEASMVDMRLMAHLLDALSDEAYLVMMGDPAQLPPIEGGSPFADMIAGLDGGKKTLAFGLERCMRTDETQLLQLADKIKGGAFPIDMGEKGKGNISYHDCDEVSFEDKMAFCAECYYSHALSGVIPSIEELNRKNEGFRILSAIRKGPWGVDRINEWIFSYVRKHQPSTVRLAIPIVIKKNDARLQLHNGDLGYVYLSRQQKLFEGEALFAIGNETRSLPVSLLPSFDLGYCLSIHKSQGSEFTDLLVLLPKGSRKFGRELLYTGVTRARRSVEIIGDLEEIQELVRKKGNRESLLGERLRSLLLDL